MSHFKKKKMCFLLITMNQQLQHGNRRKQNFYHLFHPTIFLSSPLHGKFWAVMMGMTVMAIAMSFENGTPFVYFN